VRTIHEFWNTPEGCISREIVNPFELFNLSGSPAHNVQMIVDLRIPPNGEKEEQRFVEWFSIDLSEESYSVWVYELRNYDAMRALRNNWQRAKVNRTELNVVKLGSMRVFREGTQEELKTDYKKLREYITDLPSCRYFDKL
jgi:hypothetical protein